MKTEEQNYKVYCLTNLITGMKYVGITRRTIAQRYDNGRGYKSQPAIDGAIKEYGWENFSKVILFDGLTFTQACEQEKASIVELGCRTPNGYNLEGGGARGKDVAPSVRESMRELQRKWKTDIKHQEYLRKKNSGSGNPNFGKVMSEEAKEKLRQAHIGTKHSEESHRKMRENHADFRGGNHPQARPIMQFTLDGEYIQTFPSVSDAKKYLGKGDIFACARGITKQAGGYIWKFPTK